MNKQSFVYIMASKRNGTLYIGVTNDLMKRAYEHREGLIDGFSKRYGCNQLVWYEVHDRVDEAIHREKQMKEWRRAWKLRAIEAANPSWNDLFQSLI